jgi:hypothetical protein
MMDKILKTVSFKEVVKQERNDMKAKKLIETIGKQKVRLDKLLLDIEKNEAKLNLLEIIK